MNTHMLRIFLVGFAFCLTSDSVCAQTCKDVRHYDFKNSIIRVGAQDENELQTLNNSSRGDARVFRLKNGVGLTYNFPISKTPDWQAELVMDREAHPEPSIWIRVIALEDVHMTGTGTWRYILAFSCEDGRLVRKFQFTSEGVVLKYLDNETLQLTQAIWKPTDAHADPSEYRDLSYKWDSKVHQYRLAATDPRSGGKPLLHRK